MTLQQNITYNTSVAAGEAPLPPTEAGVEASDVQAVDVDAVDVIADGLDLVDLFSFPTMICKKLYIIKITKKVKFYKIKQVEPKTNGVLKIQCPNMLQQIKLGYIQFHGI